MKSRVAAVCLAVMLAACSNGGDEIPARGPATKIDPATTGSVHGRVTLNGTPPKQSELRIAGDATCTAAHEGPVLAGDVLVKDGNVENAFVYMKTGLESFVFALPTEPVTIDQKGCIYHPHVTGAQTGQEIRFLNSDATLHNVHTMPKKSPASNFGMSRKGLDRSIRIAKAEVMVAVKCDVHPWMKAYVGVLDHPYFALTKPDGTFELTNVPAGEYTVAVWHERFGEKERKLAVSAGAASESPFTLEAK